MKRSTFSTELTPELHAVDEPLAYPQLHPAGQIVLRMAVLLWDSSPRVSESSFLLGPQTREAVHLILFTQELDDSENNLVRHVFLCPNKERVNG